MHYFRNKLNIEYSWEEFEKLNERLPEKYRWKQMKFPFDRMHQNTTEFPLLGNNRKYVSFDGYFEIVYSADNILLTEGSGDIDMGTYNYSPSTDGEGVIEKGEAYLEHYKKDMDPYNEWKNTERDKADDIKKKEEEEKRRWEMLEKVLRQ